MWPFTGPDAVWLALYVATFALHLAVVGYVVAGTGYALVQAVRRADDDPIAARVRDLLPFMLGCGITAGVAPLLFVQLLHQHRFYSANLVLGPRWGAVVPALILGFYALYVAKASARWRRAALAVGAACFAFVAWSWTELHLLMQDEPAWRELYAAGTRLFADAAVPPRLLLWLGVMTIAFAAIAAHWERGGARRRLAGIALAGHAVAGAALAWLVAGGHAGGGAAGGWLYVLAAAAALELAAWLWLVRAPDGPALGLVAGAGTAALLAGAIVREAPRLALGDAPRPAALAASGFPVFALTLVLGVLVIAWIVRLVRAQVDGSDGGG